MMQHVKRTGVALLVAALMMGGAVAAVAAEPKKAEAPKKAAAGKVASVNGVAIKRSDFERELFALKNRFGMQSTMDAKQEGELKKAVLEKMIGGELLYQASKKKGVKVEAAAVDAELANLKKRFPGDKEFKEAIKRSGITEADLKSQMQRNLAIQKLIDQDFAAKATISADEAKEFYEKNKEKFKQPEQVKASHILIEVKPDAPEADKKAARAKIEGLLKKVKAGEDFAKLAQENSQCPSSAKGGDLGFFGKGQMVPPFEAAAFGLKAGEVSGIVETQFGYHIIKLTDRKAESQVAFDTAKEQIMQRMKAAKVQEAVERYVAELQKGAKIERTL
ncbi:MAG: peptidylprolyl isomerase [Thermodesulfobacteriota bacterium]